MKPADVIKLIKDKEVKYADLRFTDTRGKEQHVTIPSKLVDEDLFREGKMFDGSSIAGWKGINESDMILSLDPTTAVIDPFFNGTRVFPPDVYRNDRMRDLPYLSTHWQLLFNQVDEETNQDIDLNALTDIRLFVYYTHIPAQ